MSARWAAAAWLLLFAVIPFALYVVAVVTNDWACYNVLPGSQLRNFDDDDPEYIRETPVGPVMLVHNWTGVLCTGLWKYSLQPLENGVLGDEVEHAISNCYQSPSISSHHRICPILILIRSFAVTAPVLTVIFCISICHIMRRRSSVFTERWDAIIFSFFPGLVGLVGWVIFHTTMASNLPATSEFLPIYVVSSFSWSSKNAVGFSQLYFIVAWVLQVLVAFIFLVVAIKRRLFFAEHAEGLPLIT